MTELEPGDVHPTPSPGSCTRKEKVVKIIATVVHRNPSGRRYDVPVRIEHQGHCSVELYMDGPLPGWVPVDRLLSHESVTGITFRRVPE